MTRRVAYRLRYRASLLLALCSAAALVLVPSAPARAGNSPAFRDCALLIGVDPDFVQLYGVNLSNGALTVSAGRPTVQIEASESSDPGDNQGHVTLQVAVTAPGVRTLSAAGHGTGLVVLTLKLPAPIPGRTYTVNWAATFDNGMHACPAVYTLANTKSSPFVVKMTR